MDLNPYRIFKYNKRLSFFYGVYKKTCFLFNIKKNIKGKSNTLSFSDKSKIQEVKIEITGNKSVFSLTDSIINRLYINIKGSNNQIKAINKSILEKNRIQIFGDNNQIQIAENCFFNNVIIKVFGNNHKIIIDSNVRFNFGGVIWIEDENCLVHIGENTTFENVHLAATEINSKIEIGKDCMFAYDIDIRTGDSHSIIDAFTKKRLNKAEDIIIGNHVWIASHCTILKGVEIMDNTVVATRSVSTGKFYQGNILIGGIPSKILKENISWSRERT